MSTQRYKTLRTKEKKKKKKGRVSVERQPAAQSAPRRNWGGPFSTWLVKRDWNHYETDFSEICVCMCDMLSALSVSNALCSVRHVAISFIKFCWVNSVLHASSHALADSHPFAYEVIQNYCPTL